LHPAFYGKSSGINAFGQAKSRVVVALTFMSVVNACLYGNTRFPIDAFYKLMKLLILKKLSTFLATHSLIG